MTLALYVAAGLFLAWLAASLAFTFLSLAQAIVGLPGRILSWMSEREDRRQRRE